MFRTTFTLFLLLMCLPVKAIIITVGFSGTVDQNFFNVAEDTVVFGSFTFDSNAGFFEFPAGTRRYLASSASITALGETVTINSGYIGVGSNFLDFSAGPALGLSSVFGNTETFSDTLDGIFVGGMGFNVNGVFEDNVLPSSSAQIYGASGSFFINRSIGTLFDVDSPDQLQVPPTTSNVSTPNLFGFMLVGYLLLFWRKSNVWITRQT